MSLMINSVWVGFNIFADFLCFQITEYAEQVKEGAKMTVYRVRFAPWIPFVDPILGEDNKFHLGGVAKDVYEGMKIFMDFNYHAVSQSDNIYGAKVNGTWNGMIGSMVKNETDISGPYFIDEDRSLAVEFSDPVAFSQLTIVSGLISSNRDPFLILAVFSMPVWIALFVTTLAVSAVACLIYQLLPAREKREKMETYSKYLWAFHTGLIGKVHIQDGMALKFREEDTGSNVVLVILLRFNIKRKLDSLKSTEFNPNLVPAFKVQHLIQKDKRIVGVSKSKIIDFEIYMELSSPINSLQSGKTR
ncbi:hypothetical protein AVEN_216839-1 [Araneus ventricosus]|uniref:Ionotropic glutamate receptor L-glutamate and glycine-binding domain-containing protein n=1 Tax=Araneus ventricosus TaxID=182803 RepID=A0A4Y2JJV3_ARAVE|nr:hypothetical protein AVEN_216839-1 [Araneus ventricosus]